MSWYLTIAPQPGQPPLVETHRLVQFLGSLAELRQTGPIAFESVPGQPWVSLILAKCGPSGGYASNGQFIAEIDIVELVCGDSGDSAWCDQLACRIAQFLHWTAVEEQENRQLWP